MTIAENAAPSSVPGQPNTEVMAAMVAEVRPAAVTVIRLTVSAGVRPVGCCSDAVCPPRLMFRFPLSYFD
jgi:hypothetical protein